MRDFMRSMSAILFVVICFAVLPLQAQPLIAGGAATGTATIAKINPANVLVDDFQGWGVSPMLSAAIPIGMNTRTLSSIASS
jgi:hypothetical protein